MVFPAFFLRGYRVYCLFSIFKDHKDEKGSDQGALQGTDLRGQTGLKTGQKEGIFIEKGENQKGTAGRGREGARKL